MNIITLFKGSVFFFLNFNVMGLTWTWFCWPCSWILDATGIGKLVWWSSVIPDFHISHLYVCICIDKEETGSCFLFRVSGTACLLLSSVWSMCILCLYFILKIRKRILYCWACWHYPFIFPLFWDIWSKLYFFLYLFFFCKLFCFV